MLMLLFGFSINLLTLLALVLAIGLVVDDAIIVVENVNRHIEEGDAPITAALKAARELAGPIIAMTIVLVAVYVPIGFQGGLTGALFTEFAFTLVAAVTVSAVVALTLSPMMSAQFLRPHSKDNPNWEDRLVHRIDVVFEAVASRYRRMLHGSLNYLPVTTAFAFVVLGGIYFLYDGSFKELAPQEDQGVLFSISNGAPSSTLAQRQLYARELYEKFASYPEQDSVFQLDAPGAIFGGMVMKPWSERKRTAQFLQPIVQNDLNTIAGTKNVVFPPAPLPGADGLPIQFIVSTTQPFSQLNDAVGKILQEAFKSGLFIFVDTDLKIDKPQGTVVIDRDKAAQLGLTMADVGSAMASMLGGGYVNYFGIEGRSYRVIPQVEQKSRLTTQQLLDYHITTASGASVPLSTIAHVEISTVPESINHFQQLNSALIQGVMMPGVPMGQALAKLQELAHDNLPAGYNIDYSGISRQFVKESAGFVGTFAFALIIIFLALAAQFESFRDPLIILVSVPMSIAGALIFILFGSAAGVTLNIYTEVGLVTLMGLVSKHGILLVEFANEQQKNFGVSKREAIENAAAIRLRPILMTTAAMVLGVFPMLFASGAGAVSRSHLGLVIASGLAIGTLFTLFVVPAVYLLLGANHAKPEDAEEPEVIAAR
jgi:multidrug efflux pump